MKDVVSPVPPEEVRAVIRKCLEDAALVNYTRICNEAKIERSLTYIILISIFPLNSNWEYLQNEWGKM